MPIITCLTTKTIHQNFNTILTCQESEFQTGSDSNVAVDELSDVTWTDTFIETVSCPCNTCSWYARALAVRNTSRGAAEWRISYCQRSSVSKTRIAWTRDRFYICTDFIHSRLYFVCCTISKIISAIISAIRFRHPDYDSDRAQKLINSSMFRHLSTCNISSKSLHAFFE